MIILASCTVPDKASLRVLRETKKAQKSPVILTATNHGNLTKDKLQLRANNSFTYSSNIRGTQKLVVYAGTYDQKGDTLLLKFHKNHKDSLWTGKAVLDKPANNITLLAKYAAANKEMILGAR